MRQACRRTYPPFYLPRLVAAVRMTTATKELKVTAQSMPPPGTITTIAGTGQLGFWGEGVPGTEALLNQPYNLALGPRSVYFADYNNHRVRRVDPSGMIATVAGTGDAGDAGDGGPAVLAQLRYPLGVAVGPDGSVYIADTGNDRVRVVRPDQTLGTLAGTGELGFGGDGGPATRALLNTPADVAVDQANVVYIADRDNHRIRRVAPDGSISTFGGDGGPLPQAQLNAPVSVAPGPAGSLYIADGANWRVRWATPDGLITTVAGNGAFTYSGDGGLAIRAGMGLHDITGGPDRTIYIADYLNHRIRCVGPDGIITTLAGTGERGYGGDGRDARRARFDFPGGLALDPAGSLYIGDSHNGRLRKIWFATPLLPPVHGRV